MFDRPTETVPREGSKCPHCGASLRNHRHRLSPGLISGLMKLARHTHEAINIREIGLTRSEWDNFQKLRYWGLVIHHGGKKSGVWQISELALDFLSDTKQLRPIVWTRRGEVQKFGGDPKRVAEILADTQFFDTYTEYRDADLVDRDHPQSIKHTADDPSDS